MKIERLKTATGEIVENYIAETEEDRRELEKRALANEIEVLGSFSEESEAEDEAEFLGY